MALAFLRNHASFLAIFISLYCSSISHPFFTTQKCFHTCFYVDGSLLLPVFLLFTPQSGAIIPFVIALCKHADRPNEPITTTKSA